MAYKFASKGQTLNRSAAMLTVLAVSLLLGSCSVIQVLKVDAPTADCAGSGQHFCHDTLIRTSLWNGRRGKKDLNCGCNNGISRVKVTTKPMDVILGFVTAGFIVKHRIEWDCAQRSGSGKIH